MITEYEHNSLCRIAEAKLYLFKFITDTLSKKIPDLTLMELLVVYQDLSMDLTREAIKDERKEEEVKVKQPSQPEQPYQPRQFWGLGDALCSFSCPHCNSTNCNRTNSVDCYCVLYKKKLKYEDTGNNEFCYRCEECLADI